MKSKSKAKKTERVDWRELAIHRCNVIGQWVKRHGEQKARADAAVKRFEADGHRIAELIQRAQAAESKLAAAERERDSWRQDAFAWFALSRRIAKIGEALVDRMEPK